MTCPPTPDSALGNIACIEDVLRLWLEDDDVTIFCGAWSDGAIMELLPHGRARLTGQHYKGRFAGLRDLVLDDGGHHVHLDLGRLSHAAYVVAPSVCYGMRPSLELRITAPGSDPIRHFGLGLAMRHPYDADRLREPVALRYFARVAAHLRRYPDTVSLSFREHPIRAQGEADWAAIDRLLTSEPTLRHLRRFAAARAE